MNDGDPLLGWFGLAFIGLYCASLLGVGWLGHRAKKENTLSDFYLGGRGLGFVVLLLTLYATQYSGNTLFGFVGQTYRGGFTFLASVTAMMTIIGAYFIYAPRLQVMARRHDFITTGDYLLHRFNSRPLQLLGVALGIIALCNYVLTNLLALGRLTEFVSGGAVSFTAGVIVLAIIMVIYENLGGLRSVAWTDVTQGILLLAGVIAIFTAVQFHHGTLPSLSPALTENRPEIWATPEMKDRMKWLSRLLLFFFGISMYPHAIQRIYAAKNPLVLRRSLQVMVFLPLITTFLMVLLGITGIAVIPGLEKAEADKVTLYLLQDLVENTPAMKALVVLFIAAVVAATMSTIDSALLAISSMVTRDIYQPLNPKADEGSLTRFGKIISIILMGIVVALTIHLKDQTIWSLIELKLELLCQIAPAFFLGLHWRSLRAGPVLAGMAIGTLLSAILKFNSPEFVSASGISPGLWGLAANVTILVVLQKLRPGTATE